MDSEGVTKLIEMVNLPLASDSKEKTLLEANGIISNQETVDKSQSTKASEKENQNIIENEIELTLKNGESNVKNVANNDDATKNENKEEYSHAEMTTKTTTIVTEKSNEESASTHTETKTANTVSVKANETATIAAVTKSDNDDVIPLKDNSIMEVEVEVEKAKPKLNESDKVIPDEPATDATERNAEKSQEIESGESTSDEDEDQEAEAETEIKTEKIDGVQGETKISDQPESPERLKTDEDVLNVKTNNANKEINNQIISIISDIDINIKAQEKITQLKEQELELIQKQKELANQIHQQQLLAQKLIAQNQLKEQEFQAQQSLLQQQQQKFEIQNEYEKEATVPKVSQQLLAQKLIAQNKLKDQEFQAQRSLQQQQKFQIQNEYDKETVLPKVSQEYTKLNNRQKDCYELKESSNVSRTVDLRKIFTPATDAPQILPKNRKLYASSAFYSSTLHPTVEDQVELARRISHSLSDISNQKSKGQSMYVNRKKRSVKWVHEASGQDYQQYQARPVSSPNILPAYSDAGKHRVQLNIHQDQLIEKYSKPEIQVVQSPWEAALQTGSASTAFLDGPKYQRSYTPSASVASPSPVNFNQDVRDFNLSGSELPSRLPTHCTSSNSNQDSYTAAYNTPIQPCNPQRELAYKPTVAQGWGGRNVELPKGLYVPKEISLSSYAPPPTQSRDYPGSAKVDFSRGHHNSLTGDVRPEFPISNATASGLYSSVPPKQQHHVPVSYDKVQSVPQVNFNPSPLSFDKLSKFQETGNSIQNQRYLNVNKPHPNSSVQNASPTPFGSGRTDNRTNFNNISQQLSHSSTPPTKHIPQQQFGGYEQKTQQMRSSPGQCFNNSARGWRTTSNTTTQRNVFYSKIPVVATESLPYSDF